MSNQSTHSETGNGAKASSITIFDGYVTYTYYLAPSHGKWSIQDLYDAARKVCDSPETPGVKVPDWESLYRKQVAATDEWKGARNKLLAELAEVTARRDELAHDLQPRSLREIADFPAGEIGSIYRNDARAICDQLSELNYQITMLNGQERRHKDEVVKLNADYLRVMVERDQLRASIGVVESWMPKPPENLREDIIRAINCRNAESGSDTPDWILGNFLMASLEAFDAAVKDRTQYYGEHGPIPTNPPIG